MSDTVDFFHRRLDQMIDLRHPLAVLSSRMPWQELEASVSHLFAKKVRAGKVIDEADLFGGISKVVGAGVSPAGRPRLPLRLMISLLYLKHAFNDCDEGVVERWGRDGHLAVLLGDGLFRTSLALRPVPTRALAQGPGRGGARQTVVQRFKPNPVGINCLHLKLSNSGDPYVEEARLCELLVASGLSSSLGSS